MSIIDLDVNQPQGELLTLDRPFRGYVGGFGSGKTYVGCIGLCAAAHKTPGIPQGYFAPTYPQIRDIFFPTIEEVGERMGFEVLVQPGNNEVQLLERGRLKSLIICRSMERAERIVGFKIGRALVDEIDILPMVKAQLAWRKIIARMRWKGPDGFKSQIDVTTTPEGFKFMYDQFVKKVRDKPSLGRFYGVVQASTYANEANLPDGYIEQLFETYPQELISAYLNGQFTNLTSGTVYSHYNRVENRCSDKVESAEPVHIGMDFNVGKMSAIVHVVRDGEPRAVAEAMKIRDTPAMIEELKSRYWKFNAARGEWERTRAITVYPDASGGNTSTKGASTSDIGLLKQAGFIVSAPAANPPVKDRVLAMNMAFCDNRQHRKYKVNDDLCPTYAEGLEQQAYDDGGAPDKKSGFDHGNDAGGYFIHRRFPIIKPVSSFQFGAR